MQKNGFIDCGYVTKQSRSKIAPRFTDPTAITGENTWTSQVLAIGTPVRLVVIEQNWYSYYKKEDFAE